MDRNDRSDAGMVAPVVDEAELIGNSGADFPIIEAEPEEELNLPLDSAEAPGLVINAGDRRARQSQPPLTLPARPGLQRGNPTPAPAPLHLPPPAPPGPPPEAPSAETLQTAQIRDLVRNLGKVEPAPYAFTYDDASSFEEELEEWFSYVVEEQAMLLKTQASFVLQWSSFNGLGGSRVGEKGLDWTNATAAQQKAFVEYLLEGLQEPDLALRLERLEALLYLLLGCWHETAGLIAREGDKNTSPEMKRGKEASASAPSAYAKTAQQTGLIKQNVHLLAECGGFTALMNELRSSMLRACGVGVIGDTPLEGKEAERREVWCAMTAIYVILEVARAEEINENGNLRNAIVRLENGSLLMFLVDIITKIRWDESINLPMSKVCLLLWKGLLVYFGGMIEVEKAKDTLQDKSSNSADAKARPVITASPLDYHLFRQEISSKYPAYNPPPSFFPLEPENNSILPPLKNHPNKVAGNHVFGSGLGDNTGNSTSIMHQPVHIATPAPSPPPSPAGPGGKGGKKQNYQTNQMFPFLYPPLDETSNNLGGKGSTDLQDVLVGRKWKGSDIPASILEAAELFAQRMKATRAMKQLWTERVAFMKYERGWAGIDGNNDVEDLSLEPKKDDSKKDPPPPGSTAERLALVEKFYRESLPSLQSMVIVLIKAVLIHVTTLVTQSTAPNGLQSGFQFQETQNGMAEKPEVNGLNTHGSTVATNEELDTLRTQEVLDKAVTGVLILLLKWFKVSHVLKFEYVTQLLVDSSYVPLILKLLQLQEVDKVVNFKNEQPELNFFNFCHSHSQNAPEHPKHKKKAYSDKDEESDSDDAVPPPIRLSRIESNESGVEPQPPPRPSQLPEVDELGFPMHELPKEPITNFSWRAFFTSINYLRIMQKICKNKAHRNLMLVSYKSSQFLRKSLKVPQPELRLYTLKLFKNQVPYCGRKWRQTNMRVITAVYLLCRPELRDDWLAGSDVDAEVDESVPLEQALRSLTHWHNLKRYPESLGAKPGTLEEEQDFFRNELEKMDWGGDPATEGEMEPAWSDLQVEEPEPDRTRALNRYKLKLQLQRQRQATIGGRISRPTLRRSFSDLPKTWPGALKPKKPRNREQSVSRLLNTLVIASCSKSDEDGESGSENEDKVRDPSDITLLLGARQRRRPIRIERARSAGRIEGASTSGSAL